MPFPNRQNEGSLKEWLILGVEETVGKMSLWQSVRLREQRRFTLKGSFHINTNMEESQLASSRTAGAKEHLAYLTEAHMFIIFSKTDNETVRK